LLEETKIILIKVLTKFIINCMIINNIKLLGNNLLYLLRFMLLEIQNITKVYKHKVKANDNISLSVSEGEVFGLLGPNGAGKTTLVNQVIGLTKPDSGSITINGVDVVANPGYARESCSFQAQVQAPISGLSVLQAIELVGLIRGGRKADVRRRAMELIEKLEIGEWRKTMGLTISGGVRRLVAFCMAAVVPGKIVIFDEPTNDIDPLRRRLLWQEVQALAKTDAAVLLVTHNVLEAERVVDRLAIVDKGHIIGMGTPAELKESEDDSMRLELTLEPGAVPPEAPPFFTRPIATGRRLVGRIEKGDIPAAIEWAQRLKGDGAIEEFSLGPTTLEDLYIRLVKNPEIAESAGEVG
jgi:ABC-2 type transport system ATP-binding protein